ncbi:hypothetical protein QBC37DRAFT_421790 [Rhypophila decipiens]|uniref:Uncharacterized protein n=1 Tax=Rhypophila decipiens TaxID=261697 RepID=A0AAN6Y8I8_9PEZI|nr:hypothetical protein QBC37DRAFT_421790 [Rhypophila decipiens]
MQPFLSGETTMVYLLTILTFLFLVGAGMDQPTEGVHIQEPVHVAQPVPTTSPVPAAPKEGEKARTARPRNAMAKVTLNPRLRSILMSRSFLVHPNWHKHSIWSDWSVQGWNFPLWRRNYFGRQQQPQYQPPRPRRQTMSGIHNRPAASMGMGMMGIGMTGPLVAVAA